MTRWGDGLMAMTDRAVVTDNGNHCVAINIMVTDASTDRTVLSPCE